MDLVIESLKPCEEVVGILEQRGISSKVVEVLKPKEIRGVAFNIEQRTKVLETLGLKEEDFAETDTNLAATKLLHRKEMPDVITKNWNGRNQREFAILAKEILLPWIEQEIIIEVPHKKSSAPQDDGKFHIFIWSSPVKKERDVIVPRSMWGNIVDCRDPAYSPSEMSQVIYSNHEYAAAEIVGNNLYIFHDICNSGTHNEREIFKQICREAAEAIRAARMTPEEKAAREKKIADKQKEMFVSICERRWEIETNDLLGDIKRYEEEIARAQQIIADRTRKINGLKIKLEKPETDKKEERNRFAQEFDNLCSMPMVESVEVALDSISVFTAPIRIVHRGNVYDIGKFRIDIDLGEGDYGGIRCRNLTRIVDKEWSHPNLDENGTGCLGNAASGIGQMIGRYQLSIAVDMMIQFLQYASDRGWHHDVKNWPLLKESQT